MVGMEARMSTELRIEHREGWHKLLESAGQAERSQRGDADFADWRTVRCRGRSQLPCAAAYWRRSRVLRRPGARCVGDAWSWRRAGSGCGRRPAPSVRSSPARGADARGVRGERCGGRCRRGSYALACDIVLAGRSAKFIQAFIKIGLVPDFGASFFLPRLIGDARAHRRCSANRWMPNAQRRGG